MLTTCPECDLQVSDKAISCPHCGYPFKQISTKRTYSKWHKKLPNGFGQITKINNPNLRNQYRVMVTVGKNEYGKPICKLLKPKAYFKTYNDAYEALVMYNKNPYDLDKDITMKELYERWSKEHFKKYKSTTSPRVAQSAWSYCSVIYTMRVREVRARHIKACMDEGFVVVNGKQKYATAGIKTRIKSLLNMMMDYAVEYELADKNYARTFDISTEIIEERDNSRKGHMPFTDEEMKAFWENLHREKYVNFILIQCYTGLRPQELCLIELKNVDVENGFMIGGMKTSAGTDRTIPIHSKIAELVMEEYNYAVSIGSDYLLNRRGVNTSSSISYSTYHRKFKEIVEKLNLNKEHRPHDCRMHFITEAKKYGVDEYAIKLIVGHEINDVTEKIYTKRDRSWLKEEIEKIR